MLNNVVGVVSVVLALVSTLISAVALIKSSKTQEELKDQDRKQATIEAFYSLQSEVLDKFVGLDAQNAIMMIENLDQPKCKETYDDYRVLVARLEHFAVGVSERVYDIETVDKLAGLHLIYLYKKVRPIIDYANRKQSDNLHYRYFVEMITNLNAKYNVAL